MDENDVIINKENLQAFTYKYLNALKHHPNFGGKAEVVLDFVESFEEYYWGKE